MPEQELGPRQRARLQRGEARVLHPEHMPLGVEPGARGLPEGARIAGAGGIGCIGPPGGERAPLVRLEEMEAERLAAGQGRERQRRAPDAPLRQPEPGRVRGGQRGPAPERIGGGEGGAPRAEAVDAEGRAGRAAQRIQGDRLAVEAGMEREAAAPAGREPVHPRLHGAQRRLPGAGGGVVAIRRHMKVGRLGSGDVHVPAIGEGALRPAARVRGAVRGAIRARGGADAPCGLRRRPACQTPREPGAEGERRPAAQERAARERVGTRPHAQARSLRSFLAITAGLAAARRSFSQASCTRPSEFTG